VEEVNNRYVDSELRKITEVRIKAIFNATRKNRHFDLSMVHDISTRISMKDPLTLRQVKSIERIYNSVVA